MAKRRIPDAEGTAFPWWAILDPRRLDRVSGDQAIYDLASMVTGPFFSRATADAALRDGRHNYGAHASVFCFSGHKSQDWKRLCVEPSSCDCPEPGGNCGGRRVGCASFIPSTP